MTEPSVDVVIIGAGLSGVGAAVHLQASCPDRSFRILEGRSASGGTWDLFRYPGIRSDSDMHTLGYDFKPWRHEKSIADGPSILAYIRETIDEHDLAEHITFDAPVTHAAWDSATAMWTLTVDSPSGTPAQVTCRFLSVCAGYYRISSGHTPAFAGVESFEGTIVHPQVWPEDLDHANKRIAIIGSGATAMTLVPALAKTAAHVTMVQRSPTYVVAQPDVDAFANRLRRFLPERVAYRVTRMKNIHRDQWVYRLTRTRPEKVSAELLGRVRAAIGPELTERHFTPEYDPWDQRLCLLPNGDLFDVLNDGSASVVTDEIRSFVPAGLELRSGEIIDADIIVTATGLELVTLGEIDVTIDGAAVDFSKTFTYRGVAYSGVPNLISTFGYISASWTLRADLISKYTCRLLNHMRDVGANVCTPMVESDRELLPRPWIDGFSAGYVVRAVDELPKQGDRDPWRNPQRYRPDRKTLLRDPIDDGVMRFQRVAG